MKDLVAYIFSLKKKDLKFKIYKTNTLMIIDFNFYFFIYSNELIRLDKFLKVF